MENIIKRAIVVEVEPTPAEIARVFMAMDADQQAEVLTEMGILAQEWNKPFCFQVHSITMSDKFTKDARDVMATFGEYSEETP